MTVLFTLLLLAIDDLRQATRLAERSDEVIASANRLEKLVLDIETGARGYVLTANREFLEPWNAGRAAFSVEAAALVELAADDPAQERRAREIGEAGRSYIEDWSEPQVRQAEVDPAGARSSVATAGGKRLVDALRRQFDRFTTAERELALRRDARAGSTADRAIWLGVGSLAAVLALALLFAGYLTRAVVVPVRRVSRAAGQLAAGDFSARVSVAEKTEIGELGRSFNAMADSLEENRDELESQNAELELQTVELEDHQARLAIAKDELEAKAGELEQALAEVGEQKELAEAFYSFAERLASQTEAGELAETILREIGDFAGAEAGAVYLLSRELGGRDDVFHLVATRGLDPARLASELPSGAGLAGRAAAERRLVAGSYGETRFTLEAFGSELSVSHELHVPLLHGGRALGVVSLAHVSDRPFSASELVVIGHLADQASVALANVLSFGQAVQLARFNAAVLDATLDGIRLVDLEGRTILANAAIDHFTTEVFGLPADSTLYERSAIAERLRDPETFRATMEKIASDPECETLDEFELADARRAFRRYTAPVRDASGTLIGRLIALREVTEERRADELKSELMATVSHELRTPLASILGFAELLVTREYDGAIRTKHLETIYQEARRLTELVNDFLDLQRIEEGRLRIGPEKFDLGDLLREEVELFSAQSGAHSLELELPTDRLLVHGDRDRVAQVVGNLLSNAIKYSPAGGAVRVQAGIAGAAIRVSITDSGLGIPSDQQNRIFEKFFRVHDPDRRGIGGTGLGLALCREIVDAHGGVMGFESVEGEGATFWFELPAVPAPGADRRMPGGRVRPAGDGS